MSHSTPKNRKAFELLHGLGIEIGALDKPFDLDATTLRLDYRSRGELEKQYKNDASVGKIADVHLIGRGDQLGFVASSAFDFICHSHVFEHLCNPGRGLEEWLRVLKPGGRVYMIVPDMRHCFDKERALTSIRHLLDDYHRNESTIAREHYADYIVNTNGVEGVNRPDTSDEYIDRCFKAQGSLHVHTFTDQSLLEFLEAMRAILPFDIVHHEAQGLNLHVALQKSG